METELLLNLIAMRRDAARAEAQYLDMVGQAIATMNDEIRDNEVNYRESLAEVVKERDGLTRELDRMRAEWGDQMERARVEARQEVLQQVAERDQLVEEESPNLGLGDRVP